MLPHQVGSHGLSEDNKCYIISQKQLVFANLAKYIGVYLAISTLIYIFVAKFKFTLTMIIGRKREIEELEER